MFKLNIMQRWGLKAAGTWAYLLIELSHILVLGFGDVMELGAQARQRQFNDNGYVRNGHGNTHRQRGSEGK
jgi:hypothetical protein